MVAVEQRVHAAPSPTVYAPLVAASPTPGFLHPGPSTSPARTSPRPSPTPTPGRNLTDQPDDEDAYQVHVLYVLPADGHDRGYDTDGTIARSVAAWDAWFYAQTGFKQHLRLDRHGGKLDITFVRLKETDGDLVRYGDWSRDAIERSLKLAGFAHPKKLYCIYYEGSSFTCGSGPHPPDLPGTAAVSYVLGTPPGALPCDDNPWSPDGTQVGYRETHVVHEILHTLGLVPACAAHQVRNGHTSVSTEDLMYAGDAPGHQDVLDAGHEYYDTGRADCLDLANSAFLTPTRPGAAPPPLWDRAIAVDPDHWAPLPTPGG